MRIEKFTVTETTNPQELAVLRCKNEVWDICVNCKKNDFCSLKYSRFPGYYEILKDDFKNVYNALKTVVKNSRLKKAIRRIKFDAELKHGGKK